MSLQMSNVSVKAKNVQSTTAKVSIMDHPPITFGPMRKPSPMMLMMAIDMSIIISVKSNLFSKAKIGSAIIFESNLILELFLFLEIMSCYPH